MTRYRRRLTGLLSLIVILLAAALLLLPEPEVPASGPYEGYRQRSRDAAVDDAAESTPGSGTGQVPERGYTDSVPSEAQDYRNSSEGSATVSLTRPEESGDLLPAGRIAVVIDDAGNRPADVDGFAALGLPITIAVLPQLPGTTDAAERARRAGLEVILHLPLEASTGQWPGPGTIFTTNTEDEIAELVRQNLASVPGAVGVNSHMGSLATADPRVMASVSRELARHGVFFLDSRTTAQTVAAQEARRAGLPTLERSGFLDNSADSEAIREALLGAVRANQGQDVILIGHAGTQTLPAVLGQELSRLQTLGWEIVPLSALVPQS